MGTSLKQGGSRLGGRARAALAKRGPGVRPAPAPSALPADGDDTAFPVEAPTFGIGAGEGGADLAGAVDDWAGMDRVADMVDEPAEVRRRR